MRLVLATLFLAASLLSQYVSWLPPHAVLMPAFPMNVTHLVAYEGSRPVYIAQVGLAFNGSEAERQAVTQYLYTQCRYVAVDVLDISVVESGEVWLSDVYCSSDGRQWLLLRWLPLRFAAYRGYVDFVNATNATAVTPIGIFKDYVPAGWYLDPATKTVFRLPQFNISLLAEIDRLNAALQQLKAEMQRGGANISQTTTLIAQLKAQVEALETQRRALEDAVKQRETVVAALNANLQAARAENDALRRRLEELRQENEALRKRTADLNKTYLAEISQLEAEIQSMRLQAVEEHGGCFNYLPILAIALAGAVAFVMYRRRSEE